MASSTSCRTSRMTRKMLFQLASRRTRGIQHLSQQHYQQHYQHPHHPHHHHHAVQFQHACYTAIPQTPHTSPYYNHTHHHQQHHMSPSQVQSQLQLYSFYNSSVYVRDEELHPNSEHLVDMRDVIALASQTPTPLSLVDLYRYASVDESQRLRNAQFLHKELPIRIAQRITDLLHLPHGLNKTEPVRKVVSTYQWYLYQMLRSKFPTNLQQEAAFTTLLEDIVQDRSTIPTAIAEGIILLKQDENGNNTTPSNQIEEMEASLYRFFRGRVGLRFLVEHHIMSQHDRKLDFWNKAPLSSYYNSDDIYDDDDFMGCVQKNCDPFAEVRKVAQSVTNTARSTYGGLSPHIEVVECVSVDDVDFTYVPHHLQYMVGELLKNSVRAVMERYLKKNDTANVGTLSLKSQSNNLNLNNDFSSSMNGNANDADIEPILVVVVKGAEDVTIKVADRGGGVTRSTMQKVFSFAHSTNTTTTSNNNITNNNNNNTDDFRGFGLPLARIYAEYFGGALTLKSMEGFGVDCYLYIPVLGRAMEHVPALNNVDWAASYSSAQTAARGMNASSSS